MSTPQAKRPPLQVLYSELDGASDRAAAIVGAAFLDTALQSLIEDAFIDRKEGVTDLFAPSQPLGTYMAKVNLAHALGLIEKDERRRLSLVARIRNAFAHAADDVRFQDAEMRDRCVELAAPPEMIMPREVPSKVDVDALHEVRVKLASPADPRGLFTESVCYLLMVLYGRRSLAATRKPTSPAPYQHAGEPAAEYLVHALAALLSAKRSGATEAHLSDLQERVDNLVSIVVHGITASAKSR